MSTHARMRPIFLIENNTSSIVNRLPHSSHFASEQEHATKKAKGWKWHYITPFRLCWNLILSGKLDGISEHRENGGFLAMVKSLYTLEFGELLKMIAISSDWYCIARSPCVSIRRCLFFPISVLLLRVAQFNEIAIIICVWWNMCFKISTHRMQKPKKINIWCVFGFKFCLLLTGITRPII